MTGCVQLEATGARIGTHASFSDTTEIGFSCEIWFSDEKLPRWICPVNRELSEYANATSVS